MSSSDSGNMSIVLVLGALLLLSLFYLFYGQTTNNLGSVPVQKNENFNEQRQLFDVESNNSDFSSNSGMSCDSYDSNISDNSDNSYDSDDSDNFMITDTNRLGGMTRNRMDNDNIDDDSSDSSLEIIRERAMGLNGPDYRRRNGNKYKHDSYRALGADNDLSKIDRQFKIEDVSKNYTDRFVPMDDNDCGEQYAPVHIKNIKGTEKDKYNANNFLPQQEQKDWFETIETVDVKNTHLINIYRPIGANTIGSTHKGAIYDIRGLDKAVCPKFVVSPFLQSSWEPDRSSRSLCA